MFGHPAPLAKDKELPALNVRFRLGVKRGGSYAQRESVSMCVEKGELDHYVPLHVYHTHTHTHNHTNT